MFHYPAAPGSDSDALKKGMPVSLVVLRDRGRLLKKTELDASSPIHGLLVVEDCRTPHSSKRFVKRATLHGLAGMRMTELLPPIFDPVMVGVDGNGVGMRGIQLISHPELGLQEVIQVWFWKPTL